MLYMCILCDSTNINTITEFVPHVSGDGFNGGSDSLPSVSGYTRTLSLEIVHTTFEWNCQMVVVSRICYGISAGKFYLDNHFEYPCILSCVGCPAVRYFLTVSHEQQDSQTKMILNVKCVF